MSNYAQRRRVVHGRILGAQTDNTDVFSIIVPAGREFQILAFKGWVAGAAGASTSLEITDASHATIHSEISTVSTGHVQDVTASRFPITIVNTTASATRLKLRVNGTMGAGTDVNFEVHITDPGHA